MRWCAYMLLGGLLVTVATGAETLSFNRYQVILDRKPFGAISSSTANEPPPVVVPATESFARTIRLSAIYEMEGGQVYAGLVDRVKNDSFFLGIGENFEGLELVSASLEDEEAVLRRGSEMAVVKLQEDGAQRITAQEHEERVQQRATSYAERRRMRTQRPPPAEPTPPKEPALTGEALEKHLQEYQMEVIRQGLPPLPIPLTQEMDDQLVEEGVLPPNQ